MNIISFRNIYPLDWWTIGAHRYLYNPKTPSWADGTPLSSTLWGFHLCFQI